ncbi:enoyl-CoA hydratase-related protein [Noviherbaspirillum aerium]|uniref:enoyl-CoA hydratase-related protein n=1 Tax=Noviherbaspirillum aerium TaxID=2588497 RepID=UPI00124C2D24|nr:enoyl-CoA hydratase-related protein [Noviherbaspirillum aerium]
MTFNLIRVEVADHVAWLTLNDADSYNALTKGMQQEMMDALESLKERDDVGALIITGSGQAFCSGADLKWLTKESESGPCVNLEALQMLDQLANPLVLTLQELPMPVVAAVNGAAAGAGFSLALAADIVLAGRSAFFTSPFLPRLGLIPDMGASWMLPAMLGRARTLGLILLGERLTAEKAAEWGLIWACVDDSDLIKDADRIASRLAAAPAHIATEARRALAAAGRQSLDAQLSYEYQRQRDLAGRPSFSEGVKAFLEKRPPDFGRR